MVTLETALHAVDFFFLSCVKTVYFTHNALELISHEPRLREGPFMVSTYMNQRWDLSELPCSLHC